MKLRHVVALIFILMGVMLLGYSYNAKLAIAKPIPVAIEKGPYKVVALDLEGSPLSISSMSLAEGEYPELSKFVLEIKTQGFFMVSHDSLPIGKGYFGVNVDRLLRRAKLTVGPTNITFIPEGSNGGYIYAIAVRDMNGDYTIFYFRIQIRDNKVFLVSVPDLTLPFSPKLSVYELSSLSTEDIRSEYEAQVKTYVLMPSIAGFIWISLGFIYGFIARRV